MNQRWQDEVEIRAVLGRLALLGDTGQPDDYRTVYTDDAVWELGATRQTGIDEIVAATAQRRAEGVSGPGTGTRHLVVPLHVDVRSDTTASASSYLLFLADTSGRPEIALFGTYEDSLRRDADGWRISHRRATVG